MKRYLLPILTIVYLAFLPAGSCNTPAPNPIPPADVDAGPSPTPIVDAGPFTAECSGYCDHLKGLPCSEGTSPKCLDICQKVLTANFVKLPIDCVMKAKTVAAAVKCGAECK
jgi:hypothetical protein